MSMLVKALMVGPLQVNCFLIGCLATRQALVVDPGDDGERILDAAQSADLRITTLVNTHGHFDHIGANRFLVEQTGAKLLLHLDDLPLLRGSRQHAALFGLTAELSPDPDRFLADGDELTVGELRWTILHTPGHSPGGISLYGDGRVWVGDSLFDGSVGRTDLPGGDHGLLVRSVREKLLTLPAATVVHPGHGPDTTIGREKRSNPFVGDGV